MRTYYVRISVGFGGKCRFPVAMGDIAQLFQNLEYMIQVIWGASWSGLVHAFTLRLNFEIISLNFKLGQIMGNNLVVYNTDKFTSSLVQTQSDKKSDEEKKIVKEKAVISDDKGMLSFANMLFWMLRFFEL